MNSADAEAVLRLMALRGVGPAGLMKLLEGLQRVAMSPSEALSSAGGRAHLSRHLKPDQLAQLDAPSPRVQEQLHTCEARGVKLLCLLDPEYPAYVRAVLKVPPPVLACLGNVALFRQKAVGFCGSRAASEKGLATATDIADQLAVKGQVVVSGHAAGVDQAAHRAALAAGGATIVVLPEGILHFQARKELVDVWDWNRVLVVSEFPPGVPWSATQAMQRNKTILALSDVMILIEAGETGGSMAAGEAALAMHKPLFAPVYDGMPPGAVGNNLLLDRGALPLMKRKSTDRANLELVMSAVHSSTRLSQQAPVGPQLALAV